MLAYIYSWFYTSTIVHQDIVLHNPVYKYPEFHPRKPFISEIDLLKVNLHPKNVIPGPARNMPNLDKFTLEVLSKAQLRDILAIKLKKTDVKPKEIYYEPRHPVLRELLLKTPKC